MMKICLAFAMGVALFAATPTRAADPKDEIPSDPEFDRFVDLKVLGEAVANGKAAQVADCAIKLAEGERKLSRKHKAISADKVFELAKRLAITNHDKETLTRLLEAAKAAKDTDQIEDIERARKFVDAPRATDPDAAALAKASAAHAVVFRSLTEEIRTAKAVGNRGQIDGLEKTINNMDPYDTALKGSLIKKVADARAALPAKDDGDSDVLARLAMSSRSVKGGGVFDTVRITLLNATKDTIHVVYLPRLGQKELEAIVGEQTRDYSLQFVKGKPAVIALEKGEAVVVKEGESYRIEKDGDKYVLKPAPPK